MGGKSGSAPKAPNPNEVAQAESQWNRLDVYGPGGGGVVHGHTDAQGNFVQGMPTDGQQAAQKVLEGPSQQAIRQMLEPASEIFAGQIVADNFGNMPGAPRVGERQTVSMTPERSSVAQSIFDRNLSMMMPGIDRSNRRLITNLQARGLPIGGEAFNDAYGEQQRITQDTIGRLAMDADVAAGQEQSRMFGLNQAERNQGMTEQSHDFNMGKAQRDQMMNEFASLLSGTFSPTQPMPSGSASPVNIGGAINNQYNAQMADYQAGQQRAGQNAQALGQVASAALMKCSVSIKDVVGQVQPDQCEAVYRDLPIYAWTYKPEAAETMGLPAGRKFAGPMAEDFHALTGLGSNAEIHMMDMLGTMAGALQALIARVDMLEAQLAYERGEVC